MKKNDNSMFGYGTNFMDYLPKYMADPSRAKTKSQGKPRNNSDLGFSGNGGMDFGLDLGKIMNMGISLNEGSSMGMGRKTFREKEIGFEDYIARDFYAPHAFTRYGKESKKDRALRSVGANESEVLYGMESLAISGARGIDNLGKAKRQISASLEKRKWRKAKETYNKERTKQYYKNIDRYESEPRQEQDNTAEAFNKGDDSDYGYEEPKETYGSIYGIQPDYSERGLGKYHGQTGNPIVVRKGRFSKKFTKYLGRAKDTGGHVFASKTYEGNYSQ